ncbi:MAG: hypothetical protein LBS93_05955 [Synergistaceae bacterium]|jgi:hypothetical protein|nr:hypothetical protein [Synergistaceae bacterium]
MPLDNSSGGKNRISVFPDMGHSLLGAFFLCFAMYLFFTLPPIVHLEVSMNKGTFNNMTRASEKNTITDLINKCFDLGNTEAPEHSQVGPYRPRLVSFIFSYIDNNAIIFLNKYIPIGARYILYPAAALCLVCVLYGTIRYLFPGVGRGKAFLSSAFSLLSHNMLASMGTVLRSGKIFAPSACLLVLLYFYKNFKKTGLDKFYTQIGWIIIFFSMMLIDEQVIATILFVCVISLIISIVNRQLQETTLVSFAALALYAVYYKYIGVQLFSRYTERLSLDHPHKFTDAFKVSGGDIFQSLEILRDVLVSLFLSNWLLMALLFVIIVIMIRKKFFQHCIVFCGALFFVVSLVCVLIASHPSIYWLPGLRFSNYLLPPIYILFSAVLFGISRCAPIFGKHTKKLLATLGICWIIIVGLYNVTNAKKYYFTIISDIGHLTALKNDAFETDKGDTFRLFHEKLKEIHVSNYILAVEKWQQTDGAYGYNVLSDDMRDYIF